MNRNDQGFTLLEIVVVMVLISIIAATVFTRSITTDQINFSGQVQKIKAHIRYAQSQAMKRSEIWGIKSDGLNPGSYWMFSEENDLVDPDNTLYQKALPGEDAVKVSLADLNLTLSGFTIFFDELGKPYSSYTDPNTNTPLAGNLTITVAAAAQSQNLTITPETGLIRNP